MSNSQLLKPLHAKLGDEHADWAFALHAEDVANKAQLGRLLGGDQTPALLFTGSHGMSFPLNDPRQLPHQGALLCQDWPGPQQWRGQGAIPQDFYFAGDDLAADARLLGLIAFFFACYGAGTPLYNEFAKQDFKDRAEIAPKAFLSRLPTNMLSHPGGGALAVIGHVERAWGYSFAWPGAGAQTVVFESTFKRMLEGYPIGHALEYFNERYAELSVVLTDELEEIEFGREYDPYELAGMWTANNDARGYAIIGDPAVRLPVAAAGEEVTDRPVLVTKDVEAAAVSVEQVGEGVELAHTIPEVAPAEPRVMAERSSSDAPGEFAAAESFGIFDGDSLRNARDRLVESVQRFSEQLGETLEKAVSDATKLEVTTYVSDDMENVTSNFSQATKLRAFTQINIDGDTIVCVPESGGEIDEALWAIHLDTVKQAQANRTEMMKAAVSAATGLLGALKVI
jgi:hypothetical protein